MKPSHKRSQVAQAGSAYEVKLSELSESSLSAGSVVMVLSLSAANHL
jgi:hypothetical protein